MALPLNPGQAGDPLPQGESVLRLLKHPTPDGVVSPLDFELSTADKSSLLKSLSVYATKLTTLTQALMLMEDTSKCRSWCTLRVDEVRAIRPDPDDARVPCLDVVWDPLTSIEEGKIVPDVRPGVAGHSGIN